MFSPQLGVIDIATRYARIAAVDAAIEDQHFRRRVLCQPAGFVDQVFVGHRLARAHAGIGADQSLGRASSMRVASEAAAKPPNTTEWMAPIRTQASITKQASAVLGR